MQKMKPMKWLAYTFLALVALLLLLAGLAFSPLGVSAIVGIANDQQGVSIESHSGSFYSQVQFNNIAFTNEQIAFRTNILSLDLSINCLFAGEVCIEQLALGDVSLSLQDSKETQEPSEALDEYITLPVGVKVDEISVALFTLYQAQADSKDSHKLLQVEDVFTQFSMQKRLDIEQVQIAKIAYFQNQNENPKASEALNAKGEPQQNLSIAELLAKIDAFEYSPIKLPKVFIPINLNLHKLGINKICVNQADTFCTQNTQATLTIAQQNVNANLSTSPQNVALEKVQSTVQVNLAKQFNHNIELSLTPNKSLTSEQASVAKLKLQGTVKQTQITLTANNTAGAQKIIEANLAADPQSVQLPIDVSMEGQNILAFSQAWLPNIQLSLNSMALSLRGDVEQYRLSGKVGLEGQGNQSLGSDINLAAQVSVKNKKLILEKIESSGEIGDLLARSQISLQPLKSGSALNAHAIDFDTQLKFTNLQIGTFSPDLESDLTGELFSEGRFVAKQSGSGSATKTATSTLEGTLVCKDIKGSVLGYQLSLVCDAIIDKDGLVNIKRFELNQGDTQNKQNKISGKGIIVLPDGLNENSINSDFSQTTSDFALALDLQDLSYFHPNLSGLIGGSLNVSGAVDEPKLIADLAIEQLEFEQLEISNASLSASIDAAQNWASDLQITSQTMRVNGQEIESASVSLAGDLQSHELNLSVNHPSVSLQHKLSGSLALNSKRGAKDASAAQQDWLWKGEWQEGEWRLAFDTFSLNEPISISASPNLASLTSHCWVSSNASPEINQTGDSSKVSNMQLDGTTLSNNKALCIADVEYANEKISSSASINYDFARAARFYLNDIVSAGTHVPLQSDLSFAYNPKDGLSASAYNLIRGGKLITSRHNIDLMAVVANVKLADDKVFTSVYAGTEGFGSLGLRSELFLAPDNRAHKGQLSLNQLQLSPLLRFLPQVERIAGSVNGSLGFIGPLDKPLLNGQINVENGELVVDNYPYPLSNFNQTVTVTDNLAQVDGEFELGAGSGEYQADINFMDQLSIVGTLKGAGMQIAFADSELLATPDLAFNIRPDNVKLSGSIAVPNAQLKLDELPASAKAPTSDTIIIGEPEPEPVIPTGLDIDLRILIDKPKLERVNIDALDLKASLAGDLRLRVIQEKNTQTGNISPIQTYLNGTVNILQGRYAAYGQVLQVRTGNIFFTGPPSLPQFDISAVRDPLNTADQVVAGIRVSGNPVVPKVEIFSEPAMVQARQLSYLLQGTDLGSKNNTNNDVLLLNMLVAYGVGGSENRVNKLGKSLGFDTLNIRTAGQGNDTQVQVTGRIAENIQVTYGVGLFDSVSEVILKYQLLPKLYIEVKSGTVSAVDLFYELSRGE
jgi:translocation and assembly module TamB